MRNAALRSRWLRWTLLASTLWCAFAARAAAGEQSQLQIQEKAVGVLTVRPLPRTGATPPGSGIVVAKTSGVVHVVAPRHVLGPAAAAPGGCVTSAVVGVRDGESFREYEATRVQCHPTIDLALLAITPRADDRWPETLPTFTEAEPAAADRGYRAIVIGSPGGEIGTNVTGSVTRSDPRGQAPDHLFYAVTAPLEPGFSGGAVLTNDLRLVAMHLKGEGAGGYGLRWSRISEELKLWGLRANLITPSTTAPYLSFAAASLDTREEAARAVVRRYVEAIRRRDPGAVEDVWSAVQLSELRALFGDARSIDFSLSQCGHLTLSTGRKGIIECNYTLVLERRTGPKETLETGTSGKKMTLELEMSDVTGAWQILSVR